MAEHVEERVADLLGRMTLEEKLAQLAGLWRRVHPETGELEAPAFADLPDGAAPARAHARDLLPHGLGQLCRGLGAAPVDPRAGARALDRLQRHLVEETRLGIPALVHDECLAGFMALGATAFPNPTALGATWDPRLVEAVADAIGAQMRSVGVRQGLGPVVDVVHDARWGRVEECFGEDGYHVGVLAAAYVRGLEGRGVVATPKHFAGHSTSQGGRDCAPQQVGPRELADVFLVPFELAIREGGARSLMTAYSSMDTVPATANGELLTRLLRDAWGFDGVVVSDYWAISRLHTEHRVAGDLAAAAAAALEAGVDVELPDAECYGGPLASAIERGDVDEALVDRAVARVLRTKLELGLFEQPYTEAESVDLDPPEHRRLARDAARASLVLLRNDGLLPLAADAGRVALVGPNADSATSLLGNYSFANHVAPYFPDAPPGVEAVTIAAGLRARIAALDVVPDCTEAAVAAAAVADVAIVAVGDRSGHFGRGTVGEGSDADDLRLPDGQEELVLAVADTGTPTVVVLVVGRPYDLGRIAPRVGAILVAWLPGEEGGTAVAEAILGTISPGGKLPVTFGRGAGQQPLTYRHLPVGLHDYVGGTVTPVFTFGHGLSYTTFAYSDLAVEATRVPTDGDLHVACTVANTGGHAGDEVVQLYAADRYASVARPPLELLGFARVSLEPGAACRVAFAVPADQLSYTGRDHTRVVEPGALRLVVAASSADHRLGADVELVGPPRLLGHARRRWTSATVEEV